MSFCLHELSINQELQDKARKNVLKVLARHDGKLTYDAINEMTFLEKCINGELFLDNISECFLNFLNFDSKQKRYANTRPSEIR